jgi:cellulose synthase/poly-beta-1,6-N-acetylglucosamine synthase-like glycosyltransferase
MSTGSSTTAPIPPHPPRITAVLPCFNHEVYLERRIDSVLRQTLPVSEILFLDDASSDGSVPLARRLLAAATVPVRFLLRTTNSGSPFVQWNEGVKQASGDYVWIAETDDACDDCLLERLWAPLAACDGLLAFAQSRLVDADGASHGTALLFTDRYWPGVFAADLQLSGAAFTARFLTAQNVIYNASSVLFRRSAFLAAGLANPSMRFCGDWDLWLRLLATGGDVAFVADPLNQFRNHDHTTRARGHTAEVQAEYMACRLTAALIAEASPGGAPEQCHLGALSLFVRQLRGRRDLLPPLRTVMPQAARDARRHYERLQRVPRLGVSAWYLIDHFPAIDRFTVRLGLLRQRLLRFLVPTGH